MLAVPDLREITTVRSEVCAQPFSSCLALSCSEHPADSAAPSSAEMPPVHCGWKTLDRSQG